MSAPTNPAVSTLHNRIDTLRGKVALVTGAGSGIGASIAVQLASLGVSVVLAGRTESKLQSTYEQILKHGGSAYISLGDAATMEGNKKYVDDAVERFGALHIAINNAGTTQRAKLVDMTPELINEVYGTNVNSVLYGLKYQLPAIGKHSSAEDKGVIINVSSVLSTFVRRGSSGRVLYQSSKAAVDMITRIGALEGAEYNTRVVAINPAYIHTELTAKLGGREYLDQAQAASSLASHAGEAWEVGDLITFLLTAQYANGNAYSLDGGSHVV